MPVAIKAEQLTRKLEGEVPVTLVKGADLEIQQGEFVAITGPSGSGKSSLLYLLGLLDRPTSGRVWLKGEDVSSYNEEKLADVRLAELGFVFQFHFLLPEFSLLENVMLPMQRLGKVSDGAARKHAEELLEQLGLKDQMQKLPRQISGGQSQRVAVARALANDPLVVLADEPTGNLDTVSSANVQMIMKDLARKHGRTVVVVTHDTEFARTADRIIHIVDGKIES
jgi:lipoprotein-releasing system ATP-binding protein